MNAPKQDENPDDTPTYILAPEFIPDTGPLPIGSLLDSRYTVIDIRGGEGRSGMGIVYIVEDEDGTPYAVKTFQRRYARDLGFVQRFIRESNLWIQSGFHPNIVHAYRVDIINAIPYLFMEYVPTDEQKCLSLADHLAFGPMALGKALDLAVQFCDGMVHATAAVPGLVHRDIKPENLLVDPKGVLKITDFGLVRAQVAPDASLEKLVERTGGRGSDPNLTGAGALMGTPAYMAPEQFSGADQATVAADIYAFGCCLYELLTAFQPFRVRAKSTIERVMKLKDEHRNTPPPALRTRMKDAPEALEALVFRCLEKNAKDRWPDFESLRAALVAVSEEVGSPFHPQPLPDATPAEIAGQMRSITLLEGYGHAIRLRTLRETQEESPYAFHLVLASYFHYTGDRLETERQLCKAFRSRESELGYEAARQLVLLLLEDDRIATAVKVMDTFLDDHPERIDYVRESWLRLQCAQHNCVVAEDYLNQCPDSLETDALRLEVYRIRDDQENERLLLGHMLENSLGELEEKIKGIRPDSNVGWGQDGDADVLRAAVAILRPDLDTSILDVVDGAVWPDLSGYPDFAPDLAWLSEEIGSLAALCPPEEAKRYGDLARLLDYPNRMRAHALRDEHWFWTRAVAMEER